MWARQDPGKQKRQGVQGQLAGHGQGAVSSAHDAGAAGELVLLQCLCIGMYARKSVSTMIMGHIDSAGVDHWGSSDGFPGLIRA